MGARLPDADRPVPPPFRCHTLVLCIGWISFSLGWEGGAGSSGAALRMRSLARPSHWRPRPRLSWTSCPRHPIATGMSCRTYAAWSRWQMRYRLARCRPSGPRCVPSPELQVHADGPCQPVCLPPPLAASPSGRGAACLPRASGGQGIGSGRSGGGPAAPQQRQAGAGARRQCGRGQRPAECGGCGGGGGRAVRAADVTWCPAAHAPGPRCQPHAPDAAGTRGSPADGFRCQRPHAGLECASSAPAPRGKCTGSDKPPGSSKPTPFSPRLCLPRPFCSWELRSATCS